MTALLDAMLVYSEARLGPVWGPAAYELLTSLAFIVAGTLFLAAVAGQGPPETAVGAAV